MIEQLANAVDVHTQQLPLLVEQMGITIRLADLPSVPERQRLSQFFYGGWRRPWAQWRRLLLRLVYPRKWEHYEYLKARIHWELVSKVITEGEKQHNLGKRDAD